MKTIILKIKGMHCTSCAMLIDGDLEDTPGIINSSTNYAKSQTTVVFEPEKIAEEKILSIINESGYDVVIE